MRPKRARKSAGGIPCPCGKVCFSKRGAEMALVNAKIARSLRNSNKRREVRAYGDCDCGHWHLTSKGETND